MPLVQKLCQSQGNLLDSFRIPGPVTCQIVGYIQYIQHHISTNRTLADWISTQLVPVPSYWKAKADSCLQHVTATILSCNCYSQCWSGNKSGASDPCTSVSASWACTCSDTFLWAVPHVQRYTEYHLTAGMHPHYSSGTGHVSQQSTLSNVEFHDTDEKLKINKQRKSFTNLLHFHSQSIFKVQLYTCICFLWLSAFEKNPWSC